MDTEQFRKRAEIDQILADYLDEVAQASDPDPAHRSVGLSMLFTAATYALYQVVKNYIDHQRGLSEAELRQRMIDQVEALIQKGWKREKALEAVQKLSKDIANLRHDNPAIKAAITLIKGAAGPHPVADA